MLLTRNNSISFIVPLLMMIMIASNSLARQKDGVQEEGEEEAGDRRKGGQTGTPVSGTDAPTGPFRSGVSDARNRRKHGRSYGIPIYRKGRRG